MKSYLAILALLVACKAPTSKSDDKGEPGAPSEQGNTDQNTNPDTGQVAVDTEGGTVTLNVSALSSAPSFAEANAKLNVGVDHTPKKDAV